MRIQGSAGVLAGAAFCIIATTALFWQGLPLLDSVLSQRYGPTTVDGITYGNAADQSRKGIITLACVILAEILIFFIGGLITGSYSETSPGVRGAASSLIAVGCGFVALFLLLLPELLRILGSLDPMTRQENAGLLMFWVVIALVVFAPTPLLGFLGGRLGGNLTRR